MKVVLTVILGCMLQVGVFANLPLVEIATNKGNIVIELNKKKAPGTVKNFLKYVDEGFYDGTVFHRVIDGFMIQGGGFEADLSKRDTRKPIFNESKNKLSNVVGTIAMARTSDPHSATAQFYINVANNTFLNYASDAKPGYCVFGRVLEGMGVVQQIKKVETETKNRFQNVPVEPVVIKRIRRVTEKQLKEEQNITLPKTATPLPVSS
jgi:cyclophilin family peptidyl-prolyl cis-trans isomerase